jgi:hypothetical protein
MAKRWMDASLRFGLARCQGMANSSVCPDLRTDVNALGKYEPSGLAAFYNKIVSL